MNPPGMVNRRGRIVLRDGTVEDVPDFLLDDEEIAWPPTLPEKRAGAPVRYLSASDFYRRHEIIEGQAFLYLPPVRELSDIDPEIIERFRQGPLPDVS